MCSSPRLKPGVSAHEKFDEHGIDEQGEEYWYREEEYNGPFVEVI